MPEPAEESEVNMQIREMGLSRRATNCLYRAGITTVEELRQKRNWELQGIRSFGAKSFREVQEALERLETEKPVTNADRIRAMSDEELAELISNIRYTRCNGRITDCKPSCGECIREWLQQPAEEG